MCGPVVLVVLDRRRAEATSQLQVDLVSKGFRAWVNDPFLLPLNATQESAKIILVPVTQEGSDIEAVNYQAGLPKTPLQWKLLWNLGVLVPLLVEIGVQGPYSPWRDLAALAWGAIGVSIYWCRLKKISQKPGGIPTS